MAAFSSAETNKRAGYDVPQAIRVGVAGWSFDRDQSTLFAQGASRLARYATRFNTVEINSAFYRSHRPAIYARWAATTPGAFRFAVKLPRAITHERCLRDSVELLDSFFEEVGGLGPKLGPVLVQLPPSLAFDRALAASFWQALRDRFEGDVVCEPRHAGWFTPAAAQLLESWKVARVAADPPPAPGAQQPAGWPGLCYLRLHGSPHMYYDTYDDAYLADLARHLLACSRRAAVWCIFDNTAEGAATINALRLLDELQIAMGAEQRNRDRRHAPPAR